MRPKSITIKGKRLPLSERTCIMGILNVTPDSFSDGGKNFDPADAVKSVGDMISNGADIIDIGGESSRPGSDPVEPDEEADRITPVIKAVKSEFDVLVSVDTYKSSVARRALSSGADIVNDISALSDADMAGVISEFGAGCVLMHMKGIPKTMQDSPEYDDVVADIKQSLSEAIKKAADSGIDPEAIMIDPGIGFGKTLEHNLMILKQLRELEDLEKPILIGTSRKAFIGELTDKDVLNREFGTAASFTAAIMNGASIIRVHNVGAMRDVAQVSDAIKGV